MSKPSVAVSRRSFLKTTAGATAAAAGFNILHPAHAAGADLIKAGLIGCGNRGMGAAQDYLKSSANVKLVAMADIFKDKLDAAREKIKANKQVAEGFAVDDDHCFTGLDAYKQLLKTDCNVVLICSPIFFHPIHLDAAIEAGKHCFMEKTACVDAPGVRQIIATGEKARAKKLNIAVRGEAPYLHEAENLARSTLMAIMGRTSAYTGKRVTWDQAMAMQEKYGPKELAFADNPVEKPPLPPGPVPR
jgi:predicted dehydrogenase